VICSLWAFLIVLFSGLLPGVRLRGRHVVGALFGLAAAALLASAQMALASTAGSARLGFALAFACALVWSSYSVASRLVAGVPSESIALSCLTAAVLGLFSSLAFEGWVLPPSGRSWLALAGLGLGPIGAAFVLWDVGMKEGNLPLLGVLAYAVPILSTLLLVALGLAEPSWPLAAACGLMVTGEAIARVPDHERREAVSAGASRSRFSRSASRNASSSDCPALRRGSHPVSYWRDRSASEMRVTPPVHSVTF
jgi:drug/metabolite transporter (DMT)-like permease